MLDSAGVQFQTGRMGIIVANLFLSLDGVYQGPGGREEDTEGGFDLGGWQLPVSDDEAEAAIEAEISLIDALLLGRKTYDIFAAYWPQHNDGQDGAIGRQLNRVPKYVASRSALTLDWQDSTQLGEDAAAEVAALRERHEEIHVIGSVDFVQTLLAAEAYDELKLFVYPIVLGQGKKVFPEGATPANLHLLAPAVTGSSGAVVLRYAPAGKPTTGDMTQGDRGA
jgi:dihydrofolate reductase